jgi:ribosomal protein S18 acetylase RimI-like enzyme
MKIIEINEFTNESLEAVQRFLCLLTPEPKRFTELDFKALLASANSHLFFLMDDTIIAGMATVGIYSSPTGIKAWIEDVVVDEAYRGRGLGRMLTQHAIDFVKSQQVDSLMLTSNPFRIAANNLYQSIGFEQKETNVYRMKFGI